MKKSFLLISLISFNVMAFTPDCEESPELSKLAVPNCLKEQFSPDNSENKDFCRECGSMFVRNYTGAMPGDVQESFLTVAANEFKKTLSNNLIETVKLAALPKSGSNFKLSKAQCSLDNLKKLESECNPTALKLLKKTGILSNLDKEMSGELAKILSNDPSFNPKYSLLKREEPQCFIPEKHLLYLTSSTIDEAFDSKLINAIRNIDPKKITSVRELFRIPELKESYKGDISELRESIKSHPYLSEIFRNPEGIINFFKSIKEPINNDSFKAQLYSKGNADKLDSKLAKNCEDSYKSFKAAICNTNFEEGKLILDPLNNLHKLSKEELKFVPQKGDLANSDELINANIKFAQYCSKETNNNSPNLSLLSKSIAAGVDADFQQMTYDIYKENKYKNDLGGLNTNLCKMTDASCVEGTFSCRLFNKFKEIQNKDSVDYKLANSTNEEVKEVLRSMIGNTSGVDPKTREILVANGIIPKDDGSFVKQPDIPERQPDFFAKAAANPQPTQLAQNNFKAPAAQPERSPASTQTYSDQGYTNNNDSQQSYSMPDFSDITRNNDELRDIQNEIRRRLSDSGSAQPTKAQARKVIRDSFASKGRSLTPAQEESYANQLATAPQQQATLNNLNREIATATTPTANRAGISNTDTQAEKWKKGQMNAALMGMAGAQGDSKEGIIAQANASQEKELTKVALNLAEDPRVTLSDVFNSKINQNDPDTQLLKVLLKNKNNFVLQVKALNFKVIFDEKQNFNVLLESGDKKEAERIRPQLEMFLKKLRA